LKIIAYSYSNPFLESLPDPRTWEQEIAQVYQDLGDRHQLAQLLHDVLSDPPDILLIRDLAELGDGVAAVQQVLDQLDQLKIAVVTVTNQQIQPLCRTTLSWLQSLQQTFHRDRIRQGHARNRLTAKPPPGAAPFGYRRSRDRYVLDRSAAQVVKQFFDHFLLYGSLRGAVRALAQQQGKKISASTGRRWLTHPVYRGDLAYQGGQVILNTHPAILSREEAARIDRLLLRNQLMAPKTASAPRSLAGLVVCSTCNQALTVCPVTARSRQRSKLAAESDPKQAASNYLYLRTTGCLQQPRCPSLVYSQVLEKTIQAICQDLPAAASQANGSEIFNFRRQIEQEIAEKQRLIDRLPSLEMKGILDQETVMIRSFKLRSEIAAAQARLDQLPPVDLLAIVPTLSNPQFWQDLSEPERRFYFREFISQIQIQYQESTWDLRLVLALRPRRVPHLSMD